MIDKINILIVEDNKIHADFIAAILENERFELQFAENGNKALELLISDLSKINIVLVDYNLPDFDGIYLIEKVRENGKLYGFIFVTADNSIDTTDLIPMIEKVYTIYQAKLYKKTYEEQLKILSAGVEQSGSSIVITDLDGKIEYVNKKFTEITGYTFEEAKGQNPRFLKSGDKPTAYYTELWNILKSGKTWKGEFLNKKKNGENFYEEAIISPIKNDNDEIIKYLAVKENITIRKQAEQQLQKYAEELKQLNADKDRFMQILAHDLKNPFNSLLGFSELLIKNLHTYDFEKIEKQLKIIHRTSQQTYNLLEDLLLWSKSQSGKLQFEPQKIFFSEICNMVIDNLMINANMKEIKLNFFETEKTIVKADLNMLKTILRNLISNAIKFTNKNGQINIYTEKINENAIITISDNGTGISKENQTKLWELSKPFTTIGTANEKGTGLGLILCKDFVEKHNGKIWVESELEKGSDFKFTIPLCD